MKSLFTARRQVFALALTIGMVFAYIVSNRYMNSLVPVARLPYLLLLTYLSGLLLSQFKKKFNLKSNLLASFSIYNFVTVAYIALWAISDPSMHESVLADFYKSTLFVVLGYPIALLVLIPATLASVVFLSVISKYGKVEK